jgi:ribosome-associated protein
LSATPNTDPTDPIVDIACRACREKKGSDLVVLEVGGLTTLADVFILCTGNTHRQVKAIVDEIEIQLKGAGYTRYGEEGAAEGLWVLLDYGDVVIHVFERETRYFYNLERLWGAAPRRPLPEDGTQSPPASGE